MVRQDEELIRAYQLGDEEALRMLYERYKRPILNFSLRILNNRSDAEDVTAQVFMTLIQKHALYKPTAKFSTWLFTVARNACISQLRKRKRMTTMWFTRNENQEYQEFDIPDTGPNPAEDTLRREEAAQVKKAIAQLPVQQKEAIVLREYHQMSYEEISNILQTSLDNVKVLIFRAREHVRGEMTSFLKEGDCDE